MKVQPKHMTAYVELEITDYKKFEQLVEDWSITEQGCSGTLMFEWYISDCKTKATLIETFADEEAQAVHMENIETYSETFMACINPQKFTYLGAVTDVVKERVAAFGFTYQVMQGGFRKLPKAAWIQSSSATFDLNLRSKHSSDNIVRLAPEKSILQ